MNCAGYREHAPKIRGRTSLVRIIDRYVAREFLISYVIALLVVLGLRIILDLFVQFDEFVEAKGDEGSPGAFKVVGYILDYYGPKSSRSPWLTVPLVGSYWLLSVPLA